jgi:hypothetical protein
LFADTHVIVCCPLLTPVVDLPVVALIMYFILTVKTFVGCTSQGCGGLSGRGTEWENGLGRQFPVLESSEGLPSTHCTGRGDWGRLVVEWTFLAAFSIHSFARPDHPSIRVLSVLFFLETGANAGFLFVLLFYG